ncbi:hypothetical protein J6590_029965 [Homalodisca vitripennis]|nr:hypothetical protein J6590_029965 [Homalodisca vitripennis]
MKKPRQTIRNRPCSERILTYSSILRGFVWECQEQLAAYRRRAGKHVRIKAIPTRRKLQLVGTTRGNKNRTRARTIASAITTASIGYSGVSNVLSQRHWWGHFIRLNRGFCFVHQTIVVNGGRPLIGLEACAGVSVC